MKRVLCCTLVLLLMVSLPAYAFNYSRFEGISSVTVEYDSSEPTSYRVTAGFDDSGDWTDLGGHMTVRYTNAGKSEEIPLILVAFTTSEIKASHMIIRTDAHRYTVTCTDLESAGLSTVDTEGIILVTSDSLDMLSDIASSSYVQVTIYDEDPEETYSFMPSGSIRAVLSLFLTEFTEEVEPMLSESENVAKVYSVLAPTVVTEDAASLTESVAAIRTASYTTLLEGSEGDDVVRLQQALIDLGYLDDDADGIYGSNTTEAVEAFQAANSLDESGQATAETQISVYLNLLALEEDDEAEEETAVLVEEEDLEAEE